MPGGIVRNLWRGVGRTRQQSDIVVTALGPYNAYGVKPPLNSADTYISGCHWLARP